MLTTFMQQGAKRSNGTLHGLLSLFRKLSDAESLGYLALVAFLAAISGTGVLYLLNLEVREIDEESYSTLTAVMFVALLVLYRTTQSLLIRKAAGSIEEALDTKRRGIITSLLRLSLRDIEKIKAAGISSGIAANYASLSQTLVPIIAGFEALVLLLLMFAYVVSLSLFAGALTLMVVVITVIGYLNRSKALDAEMTFATLADDKFRKQANAIVGGIKELQLSADRRTALAEATKRTSTDLAERRSASVNHFADIIATGTTISYMMAGAVVFVMPIITDQSNIDLSSTVIGVIFLLGPLGSVVQTIQQVAVASHTLNSINRFEDEINDLIESAANLSRTDQSLVRKREAIDRFETLVLESVTYAHTDEQTFAIRDIDLSLRRGEIIFLTGGNGSGKTTLLRVMTGLYPRAGGRIMLNGEVLPAMPPQDYRELFAGVFSDFFLFDQTYGFDDHSRQRLGEALDDLGIREKLAPDLNHLSAEHLSTGQRKRLALALALAEEKPILVLDEWAADQDPQTRRRFYEELLPRLSKEGRTIFAITHDEQYFHLCDKRIHMVEGYLSLEVSR